MIQLAALVVGLVLLVTSATVSSPDPTPSQEPIVAGPWFEPLIPDGPDTVAALCGGVCTADLVALPDLRAVESVVDLEMPETAGALSLERIWTGQRRSMFGLGWESMWDVRVVAGRLHGPLPAGPIDEPEPGGEVELVDGTVIGFDSKGRPKEICPDAARCTTAEWSSDALQLSSGQATVDIRFENGQVISATSDDGRTVDYAYDNDRLTRVRSTAAEIDYSYADGHLSRIAGTDARSFEYDGDRLAAMTDRDGDEWSFTRLDAGPIEVTRPDGEVVTYRFEGQNLIEASGSETGLWVSRDYDDGVLVAEERPREGIMMKRTLPNVVEVSEGRELEPDRRSELTFDASGRVVKNLSADGEVEIVYEGRTTRPATTRSGDAITTLDYDDDGLLVATEDPDGYRVSVERDELGRVISLSDDLLETTFTYDAAGRTVGETTAGRTARAEFGADGRVDSLRLPGSDDLDVTYDEAGRLVSIGSETVADTLADIDSALDEPPSTGDAVDDVLILSSGAEYRYRSGRSARYDQWSRLVELTVGGSTTLRSYDDNGRLVELVLPDGRTYTLAYTAAGRVESVSDGTISAGLQWHGDLLTDVTTSRGTTYHYDYDAAGRLIAGTLGAATWSYQYDEADNVSEVDTPSGPLSYAWDDLGRPIRALVDGQIIDYAWAGEEFDLVAVTDSDGDRVRIERDGNGNVTAMDAGDGDANFEYTDGFLTSYELATGMKATLSRDENGVIIGVDHDGGTEGWQWRDGQLTAVTIDDDRYDLDWVVPGILRSVTRDGETLMRTETDRSDRPSTILDDNGDEVARFRWSRIGLVGASLDDWDLVIAYDDEARPTKLAVDGSIVKIRYEDGLPVSLAVDDTTITSDYADGRMTTSRFESADKRVEIHWNDRGQPVSFSGTEGEGSFSYRSGRVTNVQFDDEDHVVTYEDGDPSAASGAGGFLEDLFGAGGRFTGTSGEHTSAPWAPWFDTLPSELGVELPSVTTADAVISAAVANATPEIAMPVAPNADPAENVADTIVALGTPNAIPVAADHLGTFIAQPDETDVESLLSASSTAVVGAGVIKNFADGAGFFGRILDVGTSIIGQLGRVGAAIIDFLTETSIGQIALSVLVMTGAFALATVCGIAVICPTLGLAWYLVPELLVNGGDFGAAVSAVYLAPLKDLFVGLRQLDPRAFLIAAGLVTLYVALRVGLRPGSAITNFPHALARMACRRKAFLCTSGARRGIAGQHVLGMQQTGARLLQTVEEAALSRSASAAKALRTLRNTDPDEYPERDSGRRTGFNVYYVDPAGDHSLGAIVGDQLRGRPEASRFGVQPIA